LFFKFSIIKMVKSKTFKPNNVDQEIIEKFLQELVKEIVYRYPQDIDFIILYGSAARGEFRKGVSDIDLVVQLKNENNYKEIEEYATKVFWELNKKYQTEFEKVLSTTASKKILDNFLKKMEKGAQLYVPIFVFPPGWFDWEKGRITRPLWKPAAIFFIHQAFLFEKFKNEGKILYGRDIRPQINPQITFWERWKALQIPFWLSLFSVLVLPLTLKQAVKYATKAVLYELDNALDFIGAKVKEKEDKIRLLKQGATASFDKRLFYLHFKLAFSLLSENDLGIFNKASLVKSGNLILSKKNSVKFVLQAFWFIVRTNWSVAIRNYLTKKSLFKTAVGLLVAVIIVYFSISFYALYKLIHPKPKPLNFNPAQISQNYDDISFKSRFGNLNISGWLFKTDSSDKTIILVSGSDQNRIDPGYGTDKVAKDLLGSDFNVLVFDFRGRGNSDYAIYSIGHYEKYDLAGAFDYLVQQGYSPNRIGVIAISLGAGTSILALPLIPNIGGIVADSSYSDMYTLIARELPRRSSLPRELYWGIWFWAKAFYKIRFDEMVPKNTLKLFPDRKFLFIHGTKDKYIPIEDSVELFRSSPNSELWVVAEADHVKAYQIKPQEYIKKVTDYFNREFR